METDSAAILHTEGQIISPEAAIMQQSHIITQARQQWGLNDGGICVNGHAACAWVQAGGREFHFKGMSQQDAQGWSQALATACVLR